MAGPAGMRCSGSASCAGAAGRIFSAGIIYATGNVLPLLWKDVTRIARGHFVCSRYALERVAELRPVRASTSQVVPARGDW